MILTADTQQVLVSDEILRLVAMHQELTSLMALLAVETRRPVPDMPALTSLRLKLSKASRQRAALLDALLIRRLQSASPAQLVALLELRRLAQVARSISTAHVSWWMPQAVAADWQGYCRASVALRRSMATQIHRESQLLCGRADLLP